MVHVTCDLCGKDVSVEQPSHFIVKIEVYAAQDPAQLTEADLDEDHVEAVGQLLRDAEDGLAGADDLAPTYRKIRFDLCPACHKKFLRDPLGREAAQNFNFSEN